SRPASSAKVTFAKAIVPLPSAITIATLRDSTSRRKSAPRMVLFARSELVDDAEEMVRRRMQRRLGPAHRGKDLSRDALPELHAPLIERIDVPYRALGEDLVLGDRDQRAEVEGVESRQHQRRARTIARRGA